jgi:hypothetical protein
MPNHYTTALLVLELTIYALEAGTPLGVLASSAVDREF